MIDCFEAARCNQLTVVHSQNSLEVLRRANGTGTPIRGTASLPSSIRTTTNINNDPPRAVRVRVRACSNNVPAMCYCMDVLGLLCFGCTPLAPDPDSTVELYPLPTPSQHPRRGRCVSPSNSPGTFVGRRRIQHTRATLRGR